MKISAPFRFPRLQWDLLRLLALLIAPRLLAQPVITDQPQSQSVPAGYEATLRVGATSTPPLGFQWRFEGAPLTGATSASLQLTNVQPTNAGNYSVVAFDSGGETFSSNATLTVTAFGSTLRALTISNAVDTVCDPIRNRVYITGGDSVLRYDLASDTFLPPWQLGGTLWGALDFLGVRRFAGAALRGPSVVEPGGLASFPDRRLAIHVAGHKGSGFAAEILSRGAGADGCTLSMC